MTRKAAFGAVLVGLLALIAGAIFWWQPYLALKRDYATSIPQAAPLYTLPVVRVRPSQVVCLKSVVVARRSEQAYLTVATYKRRRGQPLELTIDSPTYRYATRIPGDYGDNDPVLAPVTPPRHDVAADVCVRNLGNHSVALYGADDRTRAAIVATLDGEPITPTIQLMFLERRDVTILDRLSTMLQRMEVFRPGFLGAWLFWPLLVACVFGLSLGSLWALWLSLRAGEDDHAAGGSARPPTST